MVFFQENILSRTKDRAYIKNLDDKQSKVTHWISLLIDQNAAVYSDSFGIECTPQEVLSKIKDKSITRSIFTIQSDDFIVWILWYCFHRIYDFRKNSVRL